VKEQVRIIVFVDNRSDADKYLKLFAFMLRDKLTMVKNSQAEKYVETDETRILIMPASQSARGHRAHYVMNLTQDLEFDNLVARPIERFGYLDNLNDPKFRALF
jgi:hypothetical protein